MILSTELQDWLADPARQRGTKQAIDRFAAQWNAGPVNQRFQSSMAELTDRRAETIAGAIEALFADDAWVDTLIEGLASELRLDPYFEPPFRHVNTDIHTGLVVFEDDNVSIAVGVSRAAQLATKKSGERSALSVAFSGQFSVFKFAKAGNARISLWEAPPITADFTAADAGLCRRIRERQVFDGDILRIDGRYQSFIIDHAKSNLLILQATIKPDRAPLSVEYDFATRAYVGCSAADDSASRIQLITTLLRKLGHDAAFPTIAGFLNHPNFFMRWHVMKELLGLDAAAALPHLRKMAADDPHPETRRAAGSVLSRVESAVAIRKAA